ncbi:MAG TPA: class I tRNA ligase family protein, partial [Candidatus Saccharimonadales bacterium]
EVDWINGKVTATVIKDEMIDPEFGTGVMTITPWHSQADFELAERRGLDKEQIIDLKGRLLPIAGEFEGMDIAEARAKIVKKMEEKGLLVEVKDNYIHNVALNSRGKGLIEPQIRLQWFIDVNKPAVNWKGANLSLKAVMQDVIRAGDIKLTPARFEKVYFHWIDNLRDWCISRQIWWGHQIPVWYKKGSADETYVGVLPPKDEKDWQRDPDTLDTWFSSALWTWSTLIDPKLVDDFNLTLTDLLKKSPDFEAYHPTTILDTGWDILFFWVARMILATTYVTGQVPFKNVYLHGMVLSPLGGKMSKSNPDSIIDPMEVIAEYGTDSLRLALIQGMSAGNNQKLVKSKVITNRNFCNKLWNVARYVESVTDGQESEEVKPECLADHWVLKQLILTKDQINNDLDHYRFSEAYNKLYHFLWDDLADWYIESSKVEPNKPLLRYVLKNVLVMTHPFMPYVTEVIWQNLDMSSGLLAGETYERLISHDEHQAAEFEKLKIVIYEARRIIQGLNEKGVTMTYAKDDLIDKNRTLIKKLSGVSELKPTDKGTGLKLTGTEFNVWLDIDKSRTKDYLKKLEAKRAEHRVHIDRLKARLGNSSYLSQAPEDVIAETKSQLEQYQHLHTQIESEIKLFKDL